MEKVTFRTQFTGEADLVLHIAGDRTSARVLFFLPGFPDNHR